MPRFLTLIATLAALAVPALAEAASPVKVLGVRGKATIDGKRELEEGESFTRKFTLVTGGQESYVKLFTTRWDHTIILGKNTEIEIDTTSAANERPYVLKRGMVRWISATAAKAVQGQREPLSTPNASLILRGTDFLLSYDGVNEETEVFVFEGAIELLPLKAKGASRLIRESQWGGLGGRFGASITPWKLTPEQLERQRRRLLP